MKNRQFSTLGLAALPAMIFVFIALVLGTRLSADDSNPPPANSPAKKSSTPPPPPLVPGDKLTVAIPRAGFGKDYQFAASLIPQQIAATSTGLTGKIVRFELFPDGVDMYESTAGLLVTEDLPARRLLATFPIVSSDAQNVVIDFNKGMRRVFTEAWTSEGYLDLYDRDEVLEVPESRVFDVHQDKEQLVVRQSVQARSREYSQDLENRYEMRYFISPYNPADFEGKEPNVPDSRYVRYFETSGHFEENTGRISSRIARFDSKQPIIFYYSANTPADYVDAVKDGILYWNSAFGKEIVQAKKAPEGVTAPDSDHNVIQWVPWDYAGFAYADDLMDPMTGQSEHGQAYITSAFAFSGKANARILLRAMEEIAEPKKDDKKKDIAQKKAFPFLRTGPNCDVDPVLFAREMATSLKELLASDKLTDAAVLRTSQDYVREVVSHEVGHIMGLRHNFAGSLAGTLTHTELNDWFRDYILGKPLDAYTNKIPTASVMDYNILKAGAFIGWRMRTQKEAALPHDLAAIRWGYFDNPEVREKKLLFGTDEDTFRYGDVSRFDYGPEPVVSDYAEVAETIDLLPNNVIETFIRARAPRNPHDRIPVELVNLRYVGYAFSLAYDFDDMLSWYDSKTRSLKVENDFDFIGDLNHKERMQAHWKYLTNQLEELGGVDRALFSFLPVDLKLELKDKDTNVPVVQQLNASNMTAKLERLLTNSSYSNFVGLDDKKYSFTKDERALIVHRGKKFFEELDKDIIHRVCLALGKAKRDLDFEANGHAAEDDALAKLDERIIDLAKIVITAQDETNKIEGKEDKQTVSVPAYKYEQETRLEAARMLGPNTGAYKGWADQAKSDLNDALKKQVDTALGIDHYKDFKPTMLSRPLQRWYQEQEEILAQLPALPK